MTQCTNSDFVIRDVAKGGFLLGEKFARVSQKLMLLVQY
jgi:hypothetical protein